MSNALPPDYMMPPIGDLLKKAPSGSDHLWDLINNVNGGYGNVETTVTTEIPLTDSERFDRAMKGL